MRSATVQSRSIAACLLALVFGTAVCAEEAPDATDLQTELREVFDSEAIVDDAPNVLTPISHWDPSAGVPESIFTPPSIPAPSSDFRLPESLFSTRAARIRQLNRRRTLLSSRLRNAPSMLGDSQDGSCGSASFFDISAGTFEHPNYNCIRANIAENNSPIPRDRVYFRYNHFHNINNIEIPSIAFDVKASLPIERFTFGWEATFFEGRFSFETRVGFAKQLTSHVVFDSAQGVPQAVDQLFNHSFDIEFLNTSFLAKLLLYQDDSFLMSGGLGLNTPTARSLRFQNTLKVDDFAAPVPGYPGIILHSPVDFDYKSVFRNETFNLSPFLAALWSPNDRWFTQGFLQLDIPLNSSDGYYTGDVSGQGVTYHVPVTEFHQQQQTLFRANMGIGRWLLRKPEAAFLTGWVFSTELHFTSTLNDAKLVTASLPFVVLPAPLPPAPLIADLKAGNIANRVDILNLTLGSTFQFGQRTSLATGFVMPLRNRGDKPFDFEFTTQLNYLY